MHGDSNMNQSGTESLKFVQGRTFIAGREGHIYLNDPTASKYHLKIKFEGERVYLRDLNSANGTYLIKNKKLVQFREGYVHIDQRIAIGSNIYTARKMLKDIEHLIKF